MSFETRRTRSSLPDDLRVLEEMWVDRLQVVGERGYGARARLDPAPR